MTNTTIRDVARKAGVSETTVSLAFRPNSRISDKTRSRVLQIARDLNYIPNNAARALRHGQPNTLGFMVNDLTNPFYGQLVREVETVASARGYQILVSDSQFDAGLEVENVDRLLQARVRGILVCFSEASDDAITRVMASSVPHVALDTCPAGYQGAYVSHDLAAAGRMAVEHLIAIGRRNLVLIAPGESMSRFSSSANLVAGFTAALQAAGIDGGPDRVIPGGWGIADGLAAFTAMQAMVPAADGVLCINDQCAFGVLTAADAAGVRVGADLAVIGIDNLPVSALPRISLTSIRQPNKQLAEASANALIDSIEANEPCRIHLSLQPELVARLSTRVATAT